MSREAELGPPYKDKLAPAIADFSEAFRLDPKFAPRLLQSCHVLSTLGRAGRRHRRLYGGHPA